MNATKQIETFQKQAQKYLDLLRKSREKDIIRLYKESLINVKKELLDLYSRIGIEDKTVMELRLKNLINSIKAELIKLSTDSNMQMKQTFNDIFKQSYYGTGYALTNSMELPITFGILNPKTIEEFLDKNTLYKIKWDKRNINNILKDGKKIENVIKGIRDEIGKGLIEGKGYAVTAKEITDRYSVMANKSLRIVRTESHRAQNLGNIDCLDKIDTDLSELGIDIKLSRIWDATLDGRTREDHQAMDGQEADENGYFNLNGELVTAPGQSTDPAQSINCRCSVRTVAQGEGIEPPKYQFNNYREWERAKGLS